MIMVRLGSLAVMPMGVLERLGWQSKRWESGNQMCGGGGGGGNTSEGVVANCWTITCIR